MTRKPCEPTPMKAILTLSLGATYPTPPNTLRGTIEKPIAAVPACPMNLRRETEPSKKAARPKPILHLPLLNRSFTDTRWFWLLFAFAVVYHNVDQPATVTELLALLRPSSRNRPQCRLRL